MKKQGKSSQEWAREYLGEFERKKMEEKMGLPELPKLSLKGVSGGKLPRVIHWQRGRWAVVSGPFPEQFYRSETRDSVEKASKQLADYCCARPATTREDQYAKVRIEDIQVLDGGENEFGPVTP